MRVPMLEDAEEDRSRYNRSRSLSINSSSDVEDEIASNASSVTLCFRHSGEESGATYENRLITIESMLSTQHELLHRILSANEAQLSQFPESEGSFHPPSECDPGEYYEQARIKAGVQDRAEWNAAYIHGLIRIDGQLSKSIILNRACSRCTESSTVATCISVAENDPYYEHLVINERTCCGQCEYKSIQCKEEQESCSTQQKDPDSSNEVDSRNKSPEQSGIYFIENCDQAKPQGRNSVYFISGEGIDREIITSDIPRYLGIDALVRPGSYFDRETVKTITGFYITAYRPPTSAMLEDLRADSKAWRAERIKIVISEAMDRQRRAKRIRQQYTLSQNPENSDQTTWATRGTSYKTTHNGGQMGENESPAAQSSASTHGSPLENMRLEMYEYPPLVVDSHMGER